MFYQGQVHILMKQTTEATADRDAMRKIDPRYFGGDFLDALLAYEAGTPDKAKESLKSVIEANPGFAPARLLSALLSRDAGDYRPAAEALQAYLQLAPGDQSASKLLAATYLQLKDPKQALDLMTPYLQADMADPQVLVLAGEAKLRSQGAAAALPVLEQAARQAPDNAAIRTRVAETRIAAGDETQGIKELEAVSALGPKEQRADLVLAYRYLKNKQFDKALKALSVLEQKQPDSPGTYHLKGQAYLGQGNSELARASFAKALALKPTLVSAAVQLAQLDLAANNPVAAKGRYEAVLAHDSNNIPAMVGLAGLARTGRQHASLSGLADPCGSGQPVGIGAAYPAREVLCGQR